MTRVIRYYLRFDPNCYPATAYSLWDAKTHTLIAVELNETEARKIYNERNNLNTPENVE